jgi:hydroxymethylbilane synthase
MDPGPNLWGLPSNPRIGTSSARRKAQLRDLLGEVRLEDIRGNVPTRLGKLETQGLDGTMLAAAGLDRLGMDLSQYQVIRLHPREFVPAPAQGVLAWQVRESDVDLRRLILNLHQKEIALRTNVERKVLQLMGGGCHMPLGVYCERDQQGNYHVWAAMAETWEGTLHSVQHSSSTHAGLAEKIAGSLKRLVA